MLCGGCGALGANEATPDACSNDEDDDGDGLTNCEDPDCHAFEVCRRAAAISGPDVADAGSGLPDGGLIANPWSTGDQPRPQDAGTGDGSDHDATPSSDAAVPVDAGPQVPSCDPACADDEFCNAGLCEAVASGISGTVVLTMLSATVPEKDAIEQCYDLACPGAISIPFALCMCPPAAYVRVLHSRDGEATVVGMTGLAERGPLAEFNETFELDLVEGDLLVFEVYDNDAPAVDTLLYKCSPDLSAISDGPVSCSTLAGSLGIETHTVTAELALAP